MKYPTFLLASFSLLAAAGISRAALLTSFTDDFNRADGALGSNYTFVSGSAFTISNNYVQRNGTGTDITYLNVGTLPTAVDYSNGYSFTVSIDLYLSNTSNSRLFGLLMNYNDTTNYGSIDYRGDENNILQWRGVSGTANEIGTALTGPLLTTTDTWYTLTVQSATAGVYAITWKLQGSGSAIKSGVFTDTTPITTGGYLGFYGNVSNPGTNRYDNLTVTVVPEPASVGLALMAGLGFIIWQARRIRVRRA